MQPDSANVVSVVGTGTSASASSHAPSEWSVGLTPPAEHSATPSPSWLPPSGGGDSGTPPPPPWVPSGGDLGTPPRSWKPPGVVSSQRAAPAGSPGGFGGLLPSSAGGSSAVSQAAAASGDGEVRRARGQVAVAVLEMQGELAAELADEELQLFSVLGRGGYGTVYHGARLLLSRVRILWWCWHVARVTADGVRLPLCFSCTFASADKSWHTLSVAVPSAVCLFVLGARPRRLRHRLPRCVAPVRAVQYWLCWPCSRGRKETLSCLLPVCRRGACFERQRSSRQSVVDLAQTSS